MPRSVPGRGYRRDARDHLAVRLYSPDAILDRRERFHVLAIKAAPTGVAFQWMPRLHPEVQFRFADHILGVWKRPLGVAFVSDPPQVIRMGMRDQDCVDVLRLDLGGREVLE